MSPLCVTGIEVNRRFSTAPLRCPGVLSMRRKMIAERCQQERTEPTLSRIHMLQTRLLQKMKKEALRQILSILVGKTGEQGELIERKPVARTKLGQAAPLLGGVCTLRFENKLPLGRTEMHVPSSPGGLFRFHEDLRSIGFLRRFRSVDKRNLVFAFDSSVRA